MLKIHFQTGNFAYLNFQPIYIYMTWKLVLHEKKQNFPAVFVGKHGGDGNEKVGLTRSADVGCDSFGK